MNLLREIYIERTAGGEPTQIWLARPLVSKSGNIQVKSVIGQSSLEAWGTPDMLLHNYSVDLGLCEYGFNIFYLSISPDETYFKIVTDFEVIPDNIELPLMPQQIERFLEPELLVDIDNNEAFEWLEEKIKRFQYENNIIQYDEAVAKFLCHYLSYQTDQVSRIASVVASRGHSDTAGWHSLYTALLRRAGIPCALVFGFRGDREDGYHCCAYRFMRDCWNKVDLIDHKHGHGNSRPFIPMSIGSGINLATNTTPSFPIKQVQFLQNNLVWIENSVPLVVRNSVQIY